MLTSPRPAAKRNRSFASALRARVEQRHPGNPRKMANIGLSINLKKMTGKRVDRLWATMYISDAQILRSLGVGAFRTLFVHHDAGRFVCGEWVQGVKREQRLAAGN